MCLWCLRCEGFCGSCGFGRCGCDVVGVVVGGVDVVLEGLGGVLLDFWCLI